MKNKGTILCIISLLCAFVAPTVVFIIAGFFMNGDISWGTGAAYGVMIPIDIVLFIAAWVLAIISRVKYKNIFSLVLIVIYGVFLVFSVLGIIILFAVLMGQF